jgi:Leucine-rich repeat (LRR) protein
LSHNPIKQIGGSFGKLTKLTKISMSGCQLSLPNEDADCFNTCKESLKELRLNNNKITRLPKQFESLHALEILDLGGNGIKTIEYARFSNDNYLLTFARQLKVLADLPNLVNLNLKANPVCNSPDYKDTVKSMFPKLRVLDGERFDEKFIKRKEKLNRKRKAAAAEDSDQQILKKQMK